MEDQGRWKEVCELAAKEQDPQKLMEVTQEILRLLDEKDARLKQLRTPPDLGRRAIQPAEVFGSGLL